MKERIFVKSLIFLIVLFFSNVCISQNHIKENLNDLVGLTKKQIRKKEIEKYIEHHLKDSYYFGFYSFTNDQDKQIHVGFPLPVILWDGGLKVFLSSRFHHGKSVAQVGGNYYKQYHNKIYKTNKEGVITYKNGDYSHPSNIKPLDFSITKNVVFIFAVSLLMVLVFSKIAKSYNKDTLPKGVGRLLEPVIIYIRDDIAIPNIGEKHYKKYMTYLLTVFFFIWIVNLLGLTPLGVNVTNNIAVTFSLALMTYIITIFTSNKNYWKHIFWMPNIPIPMRILLAPIELVGMFIKPFSLMVRLYANITAGHIVLMSIIGLIFIFNNWVAGTLSFGLAFVLSLLELLVAVLQAYIFTMLSALYFGSAVQEHSDH